MTTYRYITHSHDIIGGEPIIEGTRTPVRAIVENRRLGITAEEIPSHLPHLTMAQVYAALSYYSDYQDEVNRFIERNRIPSDLIGRSFSGEELAERLLP